MVLSRIWSMFIIIAIAVASFKYLFSDNYKAIYNDMVVGKGGDTVAIATKPLADVPLEISEKLKQEKLVIKDKIHYQNQDTGKVRIYRVQEASGVIGTAQTAVEISLGLIGIMTLFMGFMNIAERAGGINLLSRIIQPFFSKLFPEVPKGHPSFGLMMLNFSANLLGLDNAATPFGLKAMDSLQSLNSDKEKATNAQIMFLCLHASGLTLIPVSIIATRSSLNSATPTDIFLPTMIATFCATMAAMIIVSIRQKINLFQPVLLAYIGGISAIVGAMVFFLVKLNKEELDGVSKLISNGLILLIFLLIVLGGVYKKINIFDAFIDGAKEGFNTCVKIIPYLVGMLVAISLLRTSGVFDLIINGMKWIVESLSMDGVDSFPARLSAILQGSSDTTFYVIAVYFGAVGVKNTRYTISSMLLSDLVGITTSTIMAYWFFG